MSEPSPIGRFAPSPSGPLHMGSLLIALASFLDVKQAGGSWFIRIDDIDPPRAVDGAVDAILNTLADLQLDGDRPVDYQSQHEARYQKRFEQLKPNLYYCTCTRAQLRSSPIYPGTCRANKTPIANAAIRIDTSKWSDVAFQDRFAGPIVAKPGRDFGDFIVKRRDELWSYQFATAIDDAADVTHVLRGQDLLSTTPQQIGLMRLLNLRVPAYCHLPVLKFADGQKLSKQHHAAPVTATLENVDRALNLLGQNPSKNIEGAVQIWDLAAVPKALKPFPRQDHD